MKLLINSYLNMSLQTEFKSSLRGYKPSNSDSLSSQAVILCNILCKIERISSFLNCFFAIIVLFFFQCSNTRLRNILK